MTESAVLVRIRCASCRNVLADVREAPDDWGSVLRVDRCRRCDVPDELHRDQVAISKWAAGKGGIQPVGEIPWRDLREPMEVARRRGKPSDVTLRFVDQAQKLDGLGDVYPLK